ncbi:MAG: PTPA-CTERM sorting domain-containing protein [Leptolyngbya sp. SIO3F4]|nr:PTPA-CTERM sorting domain-containing protein [Leptolyngbya sp. SIO3F4]
MIMFKKISCIAFGAVTAFLFSAVESAQAFSIRSSSNYTSPISSNSWTSFTPSSGYSRSTFGSTSSNLVSQKPQLNSADDYLLYGIPLSLLIWMIAEGLDTTGDNDELTAVLGQQIVNNNQLPGGGSGNGDNGNGGGNNPPTQVPSPALLPGLIGMGVAATRKRNQVGANQA